MKQVKHRLNLPAILKSLGIVFVSASLLASCTKPVPDDGKNAQMMRFDNIDNYRYCEVFVIGGNPITKDLSAAFYNTTDLNNGAATRDSCSDKLWAGVEKDAVKDEFDVLAVFKNGPRFWMYDWIELPVGTQHDFNGLQARWFGQVKLPEGFGKEGATYFKPTTVERKSKQGYKKGQTVFILDDPDGTPWVMQAYSRIVDPELSYEDLNTLENKLMLAPGWKYRIKILEEDLGISAINGVARVVQDNLENTYNACFEMDGQKNCTFKP